MASLAVVLRLLTLAAVGLLVMMYPILCKVRYESLHRLLSHREMWKQMAFSVFVNWIVAPFLMVSLEDTAYYPRSSRTPDGLTLAIFSSG